MVEVMKSESKKVTGEVAEMEGSFQNMTAE